MTCAACTYDRIGIGYHGARCTDPVLAARICQRARMGGARSRNAGRARSVKRSVPWPCRIALDTGFEPVREDMLLGDPVIVHAVEREAGAA